MNMKFIIKKNILLELFLISNLFFLTFDILIAHAVNSFHHWAEYIPLFFSFVSSVVLIFFFFFKNKFPNFSRYLNIGVGVASMVIGVIGLFYHLDSNFFADPSIKSMVYTAPLVAPLAYSGIGILLIANALFSSKSKKWMYLTLGCGWVGFLGNFILSLVDHAQNGFFHMTEWIPVISSAVLLGVFAPLFVTRSNKQLIRVCVIVIVIQVVVGAAGFILHFLANVVNPGTNTLERFIYGAPIFAPLLFINLAILLAFPLNCFAKRVEQG